MAFEIRSLPDLRAKKAFDELLGVEPFNPFGLESAHEAAQHGPQPTEYDVDRIVERFGGPLLLTGPPGSFKTTLAACICAAVARGGLLFNEFRVEKPRPTVIYVDLDGGRRSISNRFAALGTDLPKNLFFAAWETWNATIFANLLETYPGSFVVLDCFYDIFQVERGADEAKETRRFLRELRAIYERYGCNGIILDHTPRGKRDVFESFYGSQQKRAAIRAGITVDRIDADERSDDDGSSAGDVRIKVACLKAEGPYFLPFELSFRYEPQGYLTTRFCGYLDSSSQRKRRQATLDAQAIVSALAVAAEPLSGKELAERTGLKRDHCRAAIREAINTDLVCELGAGPKLRYSLPNGQ